MCTGLSNHHRMTPLAQSKNIFRFWPGWWLLLPIVVLGVVGGVFIQKDKDSVKTEAIENARLVAESIADSGWNAMAIGGRWNWHPTASFKVDGEGHLLSPPPIASAILPPDLNPDRLKPEQRSAWSVFNDRDQAGQPDEALDAAQMFLSLTPPDDFRISIAWRRGLLLMKLDRVNDAKIVFQDLRGRFPDARADSGLPLAPLIDLKLFEIAGLHPDHSSELAAAAVNLFSNAVDHPTLISADLVLRAGPLVRRAGIVSSIYRWLDQWPYHEDIRELYGEVAPDLIKNLAAKRAAVTADPAQNGWPEAARRSPVMFWVDHSRQKDSRRVFKVSNGVNAWPGEYLVISTPDGTNGNWVQLTHLDSVRMYFVSDVRIAAKSGVMARQWRAVNNLAPSQPPPDNLTTGRQSGGLSGLKDYMGVSMDIAGRIVFSPKLVPTEVLGTSGKTGGPTRAFIDPDIAPSEILATAKRPVDGPPQLVVRIHLTKPDQLYARQRMRRDYFALLVGGSMAIAIAGLVATRRAFNRQLALNEMKSNFVSSVSHELRAPIASVRLMAEGLERGNVSVPEKQHEYFRFIVQECRRLTSLIENVLDFSRIEQGRKQYDFDPADLTALAGETVRLMQPAAAERGVILTFLSPDPPLSTFHSQLAVDSRAIQQALINLIDNALKHSPGGQTVTVGLEVGAADDSSGIGHPGSGILLFVQDHGDGIPPEDHEKIFERFYRRGSELRRETQGVGIGLSIVKHVVEAHGGRVLVRSAVGQGSRFTIELPVKTP